jgi:O-antigen ligase
MLTGVAFSIFMSLALTGWFGAAFTRTIDFFINSMIPVLITANLVQNEKQLRGVFILLVIGSVIMVFHGISQFNHPYGVGWSGFPTIMDRATYVGIYSDPNDMGMFLVVSLPLVFFLRHTTQSSLFKWLMTAVVPFLAYGIYLTNSRGTLLAVMVLLLVLFYFRFGAFKAILLGALASPVLYFVMSKFRTIDANEESAQDRVYAWYNGFQMFKYNPLFGVGKGNFTDIHHLTAHNSYILVLGELGFFGFLFWFSALFMTVKLMLSQLKSTQLQYKTLVFCLIGFCITAFFISRSYANLFYVLIGLSMASWWMKNEMESEQEHPMNHIGEQPKQENQSLALNDGSALLQGIMFTPLAVLFLYIVTRVLL